MEFQAEVELSGKTATGVEVPAEVVAGLGAGKRPPVTVTINGYVYRSSIASMGGRSMLPISADVRAAAGVAAGDVVTIVVELDTAPRKVVVPPELAEALGEETELRRAFDGLSYSRQRRLVLPIDQAKTPETRARRIQAAVDALTEGRA